MVHKFSMSGLYFALDVYSGAVHLLDELSYKLLDYTGENMTENCPEEAFAVLGGSFTNQEIETMRPIFEEKAVASRYSQKN